MKKCIIVAASEFSGFVEGFTAEYVIAADGGYESCIKIAKRHPDLLIGDFDSLGESVLADIPKSVEILTFPVEKDASDLEIAVEEAVKRGFECFYIYGALGKRLDHTLASIAVLVSLSHSTV